MRTLWILNHYAQFPNDAGGLRHFTFARLLEDMGWETYIITASTATATGRQRVRFQGASERTVVAGVPVLWIRTPEYRGNGFKRVLNMVTYAALASRSTITTNLPRPDVVIGSSVHPLAALAGECISRRFNVPFLFEVRDLWPETLITFGRIRRDGVVAILLGKLRYLYQRSTQVISVLPRASEYFAGLEGDSEKVVWIPNGVDCSAFSQEPPSEPVGPFSFMYLGAHGQANDLSTLLKAVKLVENEVGSGKIVVRLIGEGSAKASLRAMAQEIGVTSVRFESGVPAQLVPRLAKEADAFVILSQPLVDLYRYGISANKFFVYMAATRPVIAALETPENPVERSGCGLVVPPGQPRALADALIKMASLPSKRRRMMALAGRHFVETHFDYRVLAVKLCGVLEAILNDVPERL